MYPPIFNGTGDLLAFLDHVQVWSTLKGYEGERKAVALASRLRDERSGISVDFQWRSRVSLTPSLPL